MLERVRQFPGQERKVYDFYRNNPQTLAEVRAPLFEDKVIDFITELAKVTEKPVSAEELYADADAGQAHHDHDHDHHDHDHDHGHHHHAHDHDHARGGARARNEISRWSGRGKRGGAPFTCAPGVHM